MATDKITIKGENTELIGFISSRTLGKELIFEFEEALKKLTERERRIMRMYYIDCMTWEQVCVETDISWTNMHRIKGSAIKKITGK